MTKKTQNIIETYKEKLETHLFLNQMGLNNWEKSYDNMTEEQHNLQDLIVSMFHYHLISEKDFEELTHEPRNICDEYKKKLYYYETKEEYEQKFAS